MAAKKNFPSCKKALQTASKRGNLWLLIRQAWERSHHHKGVISACPFLYANYDAMRQKYEEQVLKIAAESRQAITDAPARLKAILRKEEKKCADAKALDKCPDSNISLSV